MHAAADTRRPSAAGPIVFDEVYGFLPPLVALLKQARAFGVGCILATQNPMDLDYRALSNAGTWMIGKLQTELDRRRVIEGLGEKRGSNIDKLVQKIGPRFFVTRSAGSNELSLLQPRWAMSLLRGPMTAREIQRATRPPRSRFDACAR